MLSFDLNTIFRFLGIQADAELTELITIFGMRLSAAPNKAAFVKDALRAAMGSTSLPPPVTATAARRTR